MKARKEMSGGLISFLDVMCCGFGAVILLVIILNASVVANRERNTETLRQEMAQATLLEQMAREQLEQLGVEVDSVEQEKAKLSAEAAQLQQRILDSSRRAQDAQARAQSLQASVSALRAQSAAVEQTVSILRAKTTQQWDGGKRPIGFSGDGQKQYLTGLKLGGQRTLILLDSSASMLDETVVNVIRWKLTDPETRKTAPKWQRALQSLHWLVANLRPDRQFQIFQFSTQAATLVGGSEGKWLNTNDASQLTAALVAARNIVPNGGTSLHNAFAVIGRLQPQPDSVVILTDGLPTQGGIAERDRLITADERLALFADAIRGIPKGIPINTLLLPMEGDPAAAGAFWQLGILTQGAFITPSRDWP